MLRDKIKGGGTGGKHTVGDSVLPGRPHKLHHLAIQVGEVTNILISCRLCEGEYTLVAVMEVREKCDGA